MLYIYIIILLYKILNFFNLIFDNSKDINSIIIRI